MLVLTRRKDEKIMIGDDIEIMVVEIRGDKVRLGVSAPATVAVHRQEVYEAIQREHKRASPERMATRRVCLRNRGDWLPDYGTG